MLYWDMPYGLQFETWGSANSNYVCILWTNINNLLQVREAMESHGFKDVKYLHWYKYNVVSEGAWAVIPCYDKQAVQWFIN